MPLSRDVSAQRELMPHDLAMRRWLEVFAVDAIIIGVVYKQVRGLLCTKHVIGTHRVE